MFESILLDPTASNKRRQDFDSVYHLYNRVAHSVRFLEEKEKNDLLDRVRRISEFSGIKLLSWCLMTNHFHLLVYLPHPQELSREEIQRRLDLLHSNERAVFYDGFILDRAPREITKRMFNIGMFMKIVKENFTMDYNLRTGHHGTMWEGPYRFKKIPMTTRDMSSVASYQNLNPIRACMVNDYTGYPWTSFAAAVSGDSLAVSGLDFIYGGFESRTDVSNILVRSIRPVGDLIALMRDKMDLDLEVHKRERAEAVWRRRLLGKQMEVADPLTSEALVAQVEVRMARLQDADFHVELARHLGRTAKADEIKFVQALAADPEMKAAELSRISGVSESRVKRISVLLQRLGIISRAGTRRRSVWRINLF